MTEKLRLTLLKLPSLVSTTLPLLPEGHRGARVGVAVVAEVEAVLCTLQEDSARTQSTSSRACQNGADEPEDGRVTVVGLDLPVLALRGCDDGRGVRWFAVDADVQARRSVLELKTVAVLLERPLHSESDGCGCIEGQLRTFWFEPPLHWYPVMGEWSCPPERSRTVPPLALMIW